MMARRTKEEIAAAEEAEQFQVPAERPEDSIDLRSAEQRAADEQIAADYPEKTDDEAKPGEPAAIPADQTEPTG
jgi:hypothetical protein